MPIPITQPCGTYAAARRHERRREPLCEPCLDARRAWYRDRQRIAYSIPTVRDQECARSRAYQAHRRATDREWAARVDQARASRYKAEKQASRAIVDMVVVERLIDGQPPLHVSRAERAAAVRTLYDRGRTRSEITIQLHMSYARVAQILAATPETHPNNHRQEASA